MGKLHVNQHDNLRFFCDNVMNLLNLINSTSIISLQQSLLISI